MSPVTVVHWNPSTAPGRLGALLAPVRGRIDNFGDLLGPMIVDEMVRSRALGRPRGRRRLLAVGSILKLARPGDVVWGAGVNGKSVDHDADYSRVDVRAVRGPLTATWLRDRGAEVPDVFGDPGLLVASLWPATDAELSATRRLCVIPNLHDAHLYRDHPDAVSPRAPFAEVRRRILASELVVGSSLHAIVVAEAYGVPARLIRPGREPLFKYEDYYRGTGRSTFTPADGVDHAVRAGGEPQPVWEPTSLLGAFPSDLWRRAQSSPWAMHR
ncbi:polysaccharide pyruvyl transferase family protein [Rhodococcus sp. BP-241]|nr:polysaccharide pyruvyl transferase family protein [Rhodococcus sp. BP-241]